MAVVALTLLLSATSCNDKGRYAELGDGIYAEFVTNKDTMVAKLFYNKVPLTVSNFIALAEGTHPMVSEEFKELANSAEMISRKEAIRKS